MFPKIWQIVDNCRLFIAVARVLFNVSTFFFLIISNAAVLLQSAEDGMIAEYLPCALPFRSVSAGRMAPNKIYTWDALGVRRGASS